MSGLIQDYDCIIVNHLRTSHKKIMLSNYGTHIEYWFPMPLRYNVCQACMIQTDVAHAREINVFSGNENTGINNSV